MLASSDLTPTLEFVQGPVFRFCFALMVLGLARTAIIGMVETGSAWVMTKDRALFRAKLRQRIVWFFFPFLLLRQQYAGSPGWDVYHVVLSVCSLVFRLCAVIVPAFMVAHVYLWERGLGVGWPALPAELGNLISQVTIVAGLVFFLGRLYSPLLRQVEPAWAFLKPLILILPFATGVLAVHPTWSPLSYTSVMLLHTLTACMVFVLLPFAHLLRFTHEPVTRFVPQAHWRFTPDASAQTRAARAEVMPA